MKYLLVLLMGCTIQVAPSQVTVDPCIEVVVVPEAGPVSCPDGGAEAGLAPDYGPGMPPPTPRGGGHPQ